MQVRIKKLYIIREIIIYLYAVHAVAVVSLDLCVIIIADTLKIKYLKTY